MDSIDDQFPAIEKVNSSMDVEALLWQYLGGPKHELLRFLNVETLQKNSLRIALFLRDFCAVDPDDQIAIPRELPLFSDMVHLSFGLPNEQGDFEMTMNVHDPEACSKVILDSSVRRHPMDLSRIIIQESFGAIQRQLEISIECIRMGKDVDADVVFIQALGARKNVMASFQDHLRSQNMPVLSIQDIARALLRTNDDLDEEEIPHFASKLELLRTAIANTLLGLHSKLLIRRANGTVDDVDVGSEVYLPNQGDNNGFATMAIDRTGLKRYDEDLRQFSISTRASIDDTSLPADLAEHYRRIFVKLDQLGLWELMESQQL